MNIYCISGLGADESIFRYLNLTGRTKYIKWIPSFEWESLQEYAKRLCEQVDTTQPFALIGVSFGGMLAIEMNKFIKPTTTIIINSLARKSELPLWLKWIAKTKLNRWLPTLLFSVPSDFMFWFFGIKSKNGRESMRQQIKNNDKPLTRLAIDKILRWENEHLPDNLLRINAEKDLLLPAPPLGDRITIPHAGHFAVVENAEQITKIIDSHLKNFNLINDEV